MTRSTAVVIACLLSVLFLSPFSVQAQLATKKALTLEAAKKLASVAEAEALKNKWTMVIAIVDDGGNLLFLERMDNTQIGSIEWRFRRRSRQYSSSALRRPMRTGCTRQNRYPWCAGSYSYRRRVAARCRWTICRCHWNQWRHATARWHRCESRRRCFSGSVA